MDITGYTTEELVAIANALPQIDALTTDPSLPDNFAAFLADYFELDEEAQMEMQGEVSRRANLLVYAEAVDNPLDLVTPILTDEQAAEHPDLYPAWAAGIAYAMGVRIQHGGKLWKCLQAHTSQAGWEPDVAPSLWVEVAKPGEIPEWKQPVGATDAYAKGDKVTHNGKTWVSDVDANVWEPGVYGWTEAA